MVTADKLMKFGIETKCKTKKSQGNAQIVKKIDNRHMIEALKIIAIPVNFNR